MALIRPSTRARRPWTSIRAWDSSIRLDVDLVDQAHLIVAGSRNEAAGGVHLISSGLGLGGVGLRHPVGLSGLFPGSLKIFHEDLGVAHHRLGEGQSLTELLAAGRLQQGLQNRRAGPAVDVSGHDLLPQTLFRHFLLLAGVHHRLGVDRAQKLGLVQLGLSTEQLDVLGLEIGLELLQFAVEPGPFPLDTLHPIDQGRFLAQYLVVLLSERPVVVLGGKR